MTAPNIWQPYGLASDPFFQEELQPDPGATYPVSLLVGRSEELRLLARRIGGASSSRALVEGPPGIGKTSFVNRLKSDLAEQGVLTHANAVRIHTDTTLLSFTADVLRVILRLRIAYDLDSDFWRKTTRLLEGEDMIGAGLTVGVVGVQYQPSRVPPEISMRSLYEVLGEALERLVEGTGEPILLHVNNLENLSEADARRAAVLLRDLRDYLLLRGAHWVFVGASGVEAAVVRVYDQVSGIFPEATRLEPLRPEEVSELLRLRYQHLALEGKPLTPPVEPEHGARLYARYQGDLRNFLRLLSDAASVALGLEGVVPLSEEKIISVMAPRYARAIERQIGKADMEGLAEILGRLPEGASDFYVSEVARPGGRDQSTVHRLVKRLYDQGILIQSRTEGRRIYYRPSGPTSIAFGLPIPGETTLPSL